MNYGILTLLPPAAMLVFAIKTKKSFEALVFGSLVGFIIMYGFKFLGPWCEMLLEECSNADNQYILLMCGLFGSLIALLRASKGTAGFSRLVGKICTTERKLLLTSYIMGIIIFVDDYLNIMTIGTCMKNTCDKVKTPREALAYIIDATGAPVCALVPFSTWAVFYSGVFFTEPQVIELGYGSGLNTYIHAIPYMFYPIAALMITFLFSAGLIPKLGPMKKVYEKCANSKPVVVLDEANQTKEEGAIIDFLLPMICLIIVTLITGDMLVAVVSSLFVALIFYIFRKKMTFTRFGELFIEGFADMLPVNAILLSSFLVRGACGRMNLSEYVINLVKPVLNGHVLPVIIFILIALLTFVTSSFWGIEAVAVPIVIPLAAALGSNMLLVLAALVSGGVFGSHACFYSDATVLSSATCDIDNMSHALTQMPYAAIGMVISCIMFLAAGFIM